MRSVRRSDLLLPTSIAAGRGIGTPPALPALVEFAARIAGIEVEPAGNRFGELQPHGSKEMGRPVVDLL